VAVGLATALASRLAESTTSGLAAGLFLAFSYTFWTQAITAEVYTLHLLVVGGALLALLSWARQPTVGRLALFYAVFALGFGNHLSMILLVPACAVFLLVQRRPGEADPIRPRMIGLAIAIAVMGASQYAWNYRGLWAELEPPTSLTEALATFWVDVTKADWRETLVNNLSESGLQSRPAMYWFDVRQQFGVPGIVLAAIGFPYIMFRWPKRGLLLALAYISNLIFAWTYNVGDAYIFFLPSHYVIALLAGAGVAAIIAIARALSSGGVALAAALLVLPYPIWRGYDTFPAVDRAWDTRAEELLDQFTRLPYEPVYGVDTNWQIQNAFDYFMRERKPGVPWFMTDELPWFEAPYIAEPFETLVRDNAEMARAVVIAPGVYTKLVSAGYTGQVRSYPTRDVFADRVAGLHAGALYALAILLPDHEYPIDRMVLTSAWKQLTSGLAEVPEARQFTIVIGRAGEAPLIIKSEDYPFRIRRSVAPFELDIRMESWLPTDTIRRAGFGHVIVDRTHVLTLERGLSFIALAPGSEAAYHSGLFAPIGRYVVGCTVGTTLPPCYR
jgi:hypothetical protein